MRVGLSWTPDPSEPVATAWTNLVAEATTADAVGLDSVWVHESRQVPGGCSSPSILLTFLARRTANVALVGHRHVTHANPARMAEEVGVLDTFARGRAGLAFAAASTQGVTTGELHEWVDFVTAAWALDEFRYRGHHVRFPAHTPDDAPEGISTPPPGETYVPQWEKGPAMPDFLAVTPKPMAPRPPTYVDISDDDTLAWAAAQGVSPLVPAATPTESAVERLQRYRHLADAAGRRRTEVEPALERHIVVGGGDDDCTVGGTPDELIDKLRYLGAAGGVTHLIWNRRSPRDGDLFGFASQVQLMLQA